MAEHITRDTVYRSSSELFQSKRASAAARICIFIYEIYLSIYPINAEASYPNIVKKGRVDQSSHTHHIFSDLVSKFGKRVRSGVEDRPQRIVCAPHPLHRVCPNRFCPAIKLNCANMALAGLEGNLGAGRGCGRCAANTLIPSSKIFRMMHKM